MTSRMLRFAHKSLSDKVRALRATLRSRSGNGRAATETLLREVRNDVRGTRLAAEKIAIIAKEDYLARILADERYADPLRLERFGFKVFSQFEEDGIVQEIFRRIGTTNKRFVEFGVERGIENNTVKLLLEGWRGLWLEANTDYVASIRRRFADVLADGRLAVTRAFITAENINDLIRPWTTGEIDLLSIDIDGNDYYVFGALQVIRPRVVIIEYNGMFPPPMWVVPEYQPDRVWTGTAYMGSSLEAIADLLARRGYSLVGCNITGTNAFFVDQGLAAGRFQTPFSAANHYQPARYFLWRLFNAGHPPDWGRYVQRGDAGAELVAAVTPRGTS